MHLKKQALAAAVLLSSVLALAACDNQSAENAGRAIDRTLASAGNVIDDATITAKVKTAIASEQGLGALRIDVDTVNGAVVLTGTVNSQYESNRATEIANSVEGVKAVDNRLVVKSKAQTTLSPHRFTPPQLI